VLIGGKRLLGRSSRRETNGESIKVPQKEQMREGGAGGVISRGTSEVYDASKGKEEKGGGD